MTQIEHEIYADGRSPPNSFYDHNYSHLAYDFHTLEALHESLCRQEEHGAASRNDIKREKKIDLISQQGCPSDSAHE